MTNVEMNRRLAEMTPAKLEIVKRTVQRSSYTAHELVVLCRVKLAHVNAVIQHVEQEWSK